MLALLYLGEFDRIVIIDTFIIVLVVASVLSCVGGAGGVTRLLIHMALVVSRSAMLTHDLVTMIAATYAAWYRMSSSLENGAVNVRASGAMRVVTLVHRLRLVPLASMHVLRGVADAVLTKTTGAHLMTILISVRRRRELL